MIDRILFQSKVFGGQLWQGFLRWAESATYSVAGLPMAVRYIFLSTAKKTDPAQYIHWVHARQFWRLPWGPIRAVLTVIFWPILFLGVMAVFTLRNGSDIKQKFGKSIPRQMIEQFQVAIGASIAPFWYYMFELYLDERRKNADQYLTAHETVGTAFGLLQPRDGSDRLADKVVFANQCKALGVRAVPVLFYVSKGKIVSDAQMGARGPACDLFVKPRQGNGGHHSERWDYIDDGTYRNSASEIVSWAALIKILCAQSLRQDFVVQPRLENHAALFDISNGALATARIFTIRNEVGGFEATNAAFRMAIGGNSVVDNFHQGGLATAVDLKTGRISLASDMGIKPGVGWRDTHPVSGQRFADRSLPLWADAVALACAGHAAFPQHIIVGWDVAMLADGVCIIEGNAKPDLDIHQRVERAPLGNQRIAQLISFNVAQQIAPATNQN